MAIDMTNIIKPKTINPELAEIMDGISESQQKETKQMQYILNDNNIPNNITALWY